MIFACWNLKIFSSNEHAFHLKLLCWRFGLHFKMHRMLKEERKPDNQQDVAIPQVLFWRFLRSLFFSQSWFIKAVFEGFFFFPVTNAYHFLNKKANVPVRCVEFFSFTRSPVVLILNKQRQPDWWWKMVSQPQGFFWSALNLWLPRFPNFPFPGHHRSDLACWIWCSESLRFSQAFESGQSGNCLQDSKWTVHSQQVW